MSGLEVFVRTADGGSYPVCLAENDTLKDVKRKVAAVLGMDEGMGRCLGIVYMGDEVTLLDTDLFSGLGIAACDEISIVLHDNPEYKNPKTQFQEVVKSLEPPGQFSVQCKAKRLPSPTIIIGKHILGWPLAPEQKAALVQMQECVKVCDGCHAFSRHHVRFGNKKEWEDALAALLVGDCSKMGVKRGVTPVLRELVIYSEGCAKKRYTPGTAERVFGTTVLVMPSAHEGGSVVVRHGGEQMRMSCGGGETGCGLLSPYCVSFYNGCDAEVGAITSGNKVELVYDLVFVSPGELPKAATQDAAVFKLQELERLWVKKDAKDPAGAFLLSKHYGPKATWVDLEGRDLALADALVKSEVFDFCLISGTISRNQCSMYDSNYKPEYMSMWSYVHPPSAENPEVFVKRIKAMQTLPWTSDPADYEGVAYTSAGCDYSCYRSDCVKEYKRSAFMVNPKRLRHKFLGKTSLNEMLAGLKEMVEGGVCVKNILGCTEIGPYYALCADAVQDLMRASPYEPGRNVVLGLLDAAVSPLVPVEDAAQFFAKVDGNYHILHWVDRVHLPKVVQLLNRGALVKEAFVESLQCSFYDKCDGHVLAVGSMCGATEPKVPLDDVEMLKQAASCIVATLAGEVKTSYNTYGMTTLMFVTIVLKIVTKLEMDRERVFREICGNTKRFDPSVLAKIGEEAREGAEAKILSETVVQQRMARMDTCSTAAVISLLAKSPSASELLTTLSSYEKWGSPSFFDGRLEQEKLKFNKAWPDFVIKVARRSIPSWVSTTGSDSSARAVEHILRCLAKCHQPITGDSYPLQFLKSAEMQTLLKEQLGVAVAVIEALNRDWADRGSDAEMYLLGYVIPKLEAVVPRIIVGLVDCHKRYCQCAEVRAWLEDPALLSLTIRKHNQCMRWIRESLGMKLSGRGYKGPKLDIQNEGCNWIFVKKNQGIVSPEVIATTKTLQPTVVRQDLLARLVAMRSENENRKLAYGGYDDYVAKRQRWW
eukprot:TRINITY_DN15400_c0_g1_i1.p1 TRINITY_DN15400_c0_g1~~TRINITY_DN15400_c0_g1_i1.p1  ORF type:complete len:999 (+),score=231.97 TRINITY_DN15400_c0_g1_i1:28-2997(+)